MQIQFSQSRPQDVRLVAQVTDKGKVPAGLEKSLVEGMETARFKGTVGQVFEGFVERGGQVLRLALARCGVHLMRSLVCDATFRFHSTFVP